MSDPSEETSEGSDDATVRRSKRTPIPKRGFNLIDDYDSKESSKKKCKGFTDEITEQKLKSERDLEEDLKEIKTARIEQENAEARMEIAANSIKCEGSESESTECEGGEQDANKSPAPPRKSGRARKAKTFEDSICPIKKHESRKPTELSCSDLSEAETDVLKKKILVKLTANTPIGIKEETIVGKDNVEYLYRNVFVTEVLDSKRKRTCRLSKDGDTSKVETDKSPKVSSNGGKDIDNKELDEADPKKKRDTKLKSKLDKDKLPKASSDSNSTLEISDSKGRKRYSNENKDKYADNNKYENRKSIELNDDNLKKKIRNIDSKKRRTSIDKTESKNDKDSMKTNTKINESTNSSTRRTSILLVTDSQTDIVSKKTEFEGENDEKLKKGDEKKQVKQVKFAEKEEIKIFEKYIDPPKEVLPTLADSVKARRNSKKQTKEESVDSCSSDKGKQQTSLQVNQDSPRKIKKKGYKEDISRSPIKGDFKEQKLPSKNDKCINKDKSDKTKEGRKSKFIEIVNNAEGNTSLKKDIGKLTSGKKKKTSTSRNETSLDNLEPQQKKKKRKTKEEHPTLISNSIKGESEEAPIVLTFKSSDITNISPVKKSEGNNHVYDKTSTKIKKKTELKKSKKQNKKKAKKLIVSFKNNQSFQPKKKKLMEREESADVIMPSTPGSQDTSPVSLIKTEQTTPEKLPGPSPLLPESVIDMSPDNSEEVKHKKKSKKKNKTKLKKHQKIANVEAFDVADQTVVKVKKKKIYKNRNGEKILIRLIKNHCNKNGEVIKTETIIIDNNSLSIDEEKTISSKVLSNVNNEKSPVKEGKIIEKNNVEKSFFSEKSNHDKVLKVRKVGDKKGSEKKYERKVSEKKVTDKKGAEKTASEKVPSEKSFLDKKVKEDSPEYFPHLNNDIPNTTSKQKPKLKHSSDVKSNLSFKSSEKRTIFKKSRKIIKKPLSRPANKNVTVGGKVVGKTTKGMKKTGGDMVDQPVKNSANKNVTVGGKVVGKTTKGMKKTGGDMVDQPVKNSANKNVTVGGKVVGKITKGMKKTSGDMVDQPVKNSVFEPIPPELPALPITEPKNVYNFFCRKYRSIVVQQFPKADFSEISRRLAALWKTLSEAERQDQRDKFEELHSVSQQKLSKLGCLSPTMWSESDFKFIKKNISENDAYSEVFTIPKYPVKRLSPIDMAAHLSLHGDSLNVISGALQQQSSMTVHGAMSVLLDSILSALAPLIFFTSHIPEMKAIEDSQQARILDNLAYILPGL